MRLLLLTAGLVALGACGSDPAPVTVEGVDPVVSGGELTPDASLTPGDAALAPEADVTPEPGLAPVDSLSPDA